MKKIRLLRRERGSNLKSEILNLKLFSPIFLFLGGKVEGDGIDAGDFEFCAAIGTGDNFALHRLARKTDVTCTFGALGGQLLGTNGLSEHGFTLLRVLWH